MVNKILIFISLLFLVKRVVSECTCDTSDLEAEPKSVTLPYKVGSIFAILASSTLGVAVPLAGKRFPVMSPDGNPFFVVKAFAAGVILATGFIHILPDAFESLSSPCLKGGAWGDFPFAGFIAMVAAVATLTVESTAAGYYRRAHFGDGKAAVGGGGDEENAAGEHAGHVHMHTHAAGHGHAHGDVAVAREESSKLELIRHRVTTQVLELGIVVHSVIIGVSLGTSQTLATIKPLLAALCFHQFFEGLGLGGCIAQAKYKWKTIITMAMFFSLTTPLGVAIGIGVTNSYDENSPTSLIVQGVFDSAAGGILIYMALVGLLANDFMSPRMQNSTRLQLAANVALLLGAGSMSILAKWA